MRLKEDLETRREIESSTPTQHKTQVERTEISILHLILLSCLTLIIGINAGKFL